MFIFVGYASLSSEMSINGSASVQPQPKGIFITDLSVISSSGVTDMGSTYISPTNVKTVTDAAAGGSITYKITVENNTDATYWYREIILVNSLDEFRNDLIGKNGGITIVTKDKIADTTETFNSGDYIPPHTVREFYAIYSFGASAAGSGISTMIHFSFGGKIASYGDDFLAILNDPDRYGELFDAFNEAYSERGLTVLGNVGDDKELFDSLFGTELTLDGKDVTVMIKRENVDGKSSGDAYPGGPSGCDYTIYVTTEDAEGTPTVYAVSYTKESDGTWVQIGELYEGTVSVGKYTDSNGKTYDSINVDTWEAVPKTYTVFTYNNQSVTYKVNERYGNSFQQQKTIEELMSMQDQELYNQLNNHQILKDAYEILFVNHVGSEAVEILMLREAYDDAMRFYQMRNEGKEFTLDNTATRAELLSTVEALAKAMEYYVQVHDTSHS